jgi:hypothetical protein
MQRCVEPEWLDELPPGDPRAMRSRRDLQRIHSWMGNVGIMARLLGNVAAGQENLRVTELGAGDGTFMLRVARRLKGKAPKAKLELVDRLSVVAPETRRGFAELGWGLEIISADVFDRLANGVSADVITATFFLHHFPDERLGQLFQQIAVSTKQFIVCEPQRSAVALRASHLLGLIGCNAVTRHDGVISVRAGFKDRELSSLWPQDSNWLTEECSAGFASHTFAARRRE